MNFMEKHLSTEETATGLLRRAEHFFEEIIQKPEIVEALDILRKLPEGMRYHVRDHTLDVLHETILFAVADNAPRNVIEQQAISAAWHDTGFITEPDIENVEGMSTETIAIELFKKSEAYQSMSEASREEVIKNIKDTEIIFEDNSPRALKRHSTDGYILDGDLSNFGRDDFFAQRDKIAEELGIDLTDREAKKKFYANTLNLIKNHEWKTLAARTLRQEQKEENIRIAEAEYFREFGEQPPL